MESYPKPVRSGYAMKMVCGTLLLTIRMAKNTAKKLGGTTMGKRVQKATIRTTMPTANGLIGTRTVWK